MRAPDIFMYSLGALVVIGFFILLCLLVTKSIPENNVEMLHLIVGALIGAFTSVVSFFFGSSQGSKDKTKLINGK